MPSGRLGAAGSVTARPVGGKVHPADFRRQCRASPLPRAPATRPRLFRSVGKATGAEGVRASGAGGRTESPAGSSLRAPSGSARHDGARRRLSAPAKPRVLKLPGSPDSGWKPTGAGAGAGEVRRHRTGATKRSRSVLVTGSTSEAPRPRNCPPPGKGQLQEQLWFVSEVRATFVGALTKEPKHPRLPLQPRLQAAPLPRIQPAT